MIMLTDAPNLNVVNETPLLENLEVNTAISGRLLTKMETAQRAGSFKFRGAYNRIRQMDDGQIKRGIVADRIGAERNMVMVPPNQDARVLAGAGELLANPEGRKTICDAIIAIGGNVDAASYCAALEAATAQE